MLPGRQTKIVDTVHITNYGWRGFYRGWIGLVLSGSRRFSVDETGWHGWSGTSAPRQQPRDRNLCRWIDDRGILRRSSAGLPPPGTLDFGKYGFVLGDIAGEAIAVSAQGKQIVGQAAGSSGSGLAFYASTTRGMKSLGTLGGTDQSVAVGVSDTGIVIGARINSYTWTRSSFSK